MGLLGSTTPGSHISPPEYASFFFDKLSAASVVLASGVKVIVTEHKELHVPRLVDDVSADWTAEAAEIDDSDPNMDSIVATPRKLAALSYMSNELVDDSNPAVLDLVGSSMARSMSLKLDKGLLEGTGSAPQIRGLKNVSGIQTVSMGTNGAALTTLDPFADALGALDASNAGPNRVIIMPPRNWSVLSKIKEASGSNKPVLTTTLDPAGAIKRSLYGVPVYVTSQLTTTETQGSSSVANSIYVYDPDQVVVVIRKDVSITTDSSVKFSSDQTAVRGIMRADMVVPNPSAVVRIVGVL